MRCVTPQAQWPGEPVEHVSVVVRFTAGSEAAAREIVEELHDNALRAVYALVPPDGPEQGWTSGFGLPQPATD